MELSLKYLIKKDLDMFLISSMMDKETFSNETGISKSTISKIENGIEVNDSVYEKIYSYIYINNYRLNQVKESFLKENKDLILFHGSKKGLNFIDINGSRPDCDFGPGFYLGETYENALSFVCGFDNSSVYSFKLNLDNLNILKFNFDLDWMLTICFYRGNLKKYSESEYIKSLIKKVDEADLIIAPIADNRMFYVMNRFIEGDINSEVAIHSLSASDLGLQYIIKTEKALNNLIPIEKYYVSSDEKLDMFNTLSSRTWFIESKLQMSLRNYNHGKYIEEILK